MNGWKILAPISSVMIALAAGHACSTGGDRGSPADPSTDEVAQLADGCGAQRYRDFAPIECLHQGRLAGSSFYPVGSCVAGDEDHITCTYPLRCEWSVAQVTTTCVEGAGACSAVPPAFPLIQPPPKIIPLPEGSQLCVANGSTAEQRETFCINNRGNVADDARTLCEGQFSQNEGMALCCLSCISTAPGHGLSASTTCDGGACAACYEPHDGGVDGGIDPDAGIDGGVEVDASSPEPDTEASAGVNR